VDVLVIDEASMVDLEMMAAVLAALPSPARLILLGDRDQLASVEAGAVLGELCGRAREGHFTSATCASVQELAGETLPSALISDDGTPLDQAVVMLRHSYRFAATSGIGRLAEAVNAGDGAQACTILTEGAPDLGRLALHDDDEVAFAALVVDGWVADMSPAATARGYRHYLSALHQQQPQDTNDEDALTEWALSVLSAQRQFQVVCALRRGAWGIEGLNARIAKALFNEQLISDVQGWYPGRPVLMTRNDYSLGLMNGDIGVALPCPREDDSTPILRVAFPAGDGTNGVKWVLPSRLQTVETVYALTVHKSQGSEFEHVILVLPPAINPILTRELIYTGITRARSRFTLAHGGNLDVLQAAVARRVTRSSGLMSALATR
jgi:exodeoxyribonuclease V alpha subunit